MSTLTDGTVTVLIGDVRERLAELPDGSVHCVVTSPPYWGLRDYGTGSWDGGDPDCDHTKGNPRQPHERRSSTLGGGTDTIRVQEEANSYRDSCGKCGATRVDRQLGLEPTPEEYVAAMVDVFREVRRVLRADGTCWLNLGDSYAASISGSIGQRGAAARQSHIDGGSGRAMDKSKIPGLKPKDLVGIPWRVAFALQADGWYLRSDIVWSKPNPMPESVSDRPTKAHEYLFLLTRSPRYFYDADAIREPVSPYSDFARLGGAIGATDPQGKPGDPAIAPPSRVTPYGQANGKAENLGRGSRGDPSGRNKRSVWETATEPYPEAHFATFPQALVEPCVKAGTSERGCCPECGAPWVRETAREGVASGQSAEAPGTNAQNYGGEGTSRMGGGEARQKWLDEHPVRTLGWSPSCSCSRMRFGQGPPPSGGWKRDMVTSHCSGCSSETEWPVATCSSCAGEDRGERNQLSTGGRVEGALAVPPEPVPCTVLDPFAGSGTTLLVARKLGRRAIGVELSPEYAALIPKRFGSLWGQLSLLEGAV